MIDTIFNELYMFCYVIGIICLTDYVTKLCVYLYISYNIYYNLPKIDNTYYNYENYENYVFYKIDVYTFEYISNNTFVFSLLLICIVFYQIFIIIYGIDRNISIITLFILTYIIRFILLSVVKRLLNNKIINEYIYDKCKEFHNCTYLSSYNSRCLICYDESDEIIYKKIVKFKCKHEYCIRCVLQCNMIMNDRKCPVCTNKI